MNTFYFNTGVTLGPKGDGGPPVRLHEGEVLRGGTKQIPFDADAPADAHVMMLCNNPDLPEGKADTVLVREVFNTKMCSRYVYLRVSRSTLALMAIGLEDTSE